MKKVSGILLIGISLCFVFFASCDVKQSKHYKSLQAENDSLKLENLRNTSEMNEVLSILEEIQEGFDTIRDAENYLNIQQNDGELSQTRREKIRTNMQLISETLQKNKEQLAALNTQVEQGKITSTSLKKTIERMTVELNEKTVMITNLQEELSKKNVRIQELDDAVKNLSEDVENLSIKSTAQSDKIVEQEKALNTAYYCYGTAKELKEQNILTGGGLFSKSKALQDDFNQDYFMQIDIRKVTEIPLYAPKAKLRSNHPDNSYRFDKDVDGNQILKITDIANFWSLGKYLVIEVSL